MVFIVSALLSTMANVQGLTSLLETLKVGDGNASSIVKAAEADPKILESMCKSLSEQASLTGKADALAATNACKALESLAQNCITIAEPFLVTALSSLLVAASHKDKNVRLAAVAAVTALAGRLFGASLG